MSELRGMDPFTVIRCVLHTVRETYGIRPVSRALASQYHRFYTNTFYRVDFFTGRKYTKRGIERDGKRAEEGVVFCKESLLYCGLSGCSRTAGIFYCK